MRTARLAFALAFALASTTHAQSPSPLRVIRSTPAVDAVPTAEISVTFDRPVAGSLDRSVDPTTILRIEPAVRGRIEWRDPVTIRLRPNDVLASGTRYTVTVANTFRAMDGSALAEPYRFTFRAQGPHLLTGTPVGTAGEGGVAQHIAPNQRFDLVYSRPVDLAKLSTAAFVEMSAACGGQRIIRLRATAQRRIRDDDTWNIREAGGWQRNRSVDSLRRVVQLAPDAALPRGCGGELVAPTEVEDDVIRTATRWRFDTYGDLRIASVGCGEGKFCPSGPLRVTFTNPVRGAEVLRRVRLLPDAKFDVGDTLSESTSWTLEARLQPKVTYAVIADTAIRDVFGQGLRGNPAAAFRTTGYQPAIVHPFGRLLVERTGFRTLSVQHVNVDTLIAVIAPIPDSLESAILTRFGWGDDTLWKSLQRSATTQRIALKATPERAMLTSVRLPVADAARAGSPALYAVQISGRAGADSVAANALSLVQVTDLGVHARIGTTEGMVWVTGVNDGAAKAGASVVLYDARGRRLASATTDARGLARLTGWANTPAPDDDDDDEDGTSFEGYVRVTLGSDRAVTAINRWDPDLSPWRFNVQSAWGDQRFPLAGAVFTERGIYRPGERVYAKAILRDGSLGALRVPSAGDSIKWIFHDREDGVLRERTVLSSAFGTADQALPISTTAAVGQYRVEIQAKRQGKWRSVARTSYRVAEYRPPEFLVELNAEQATKLPGDRFGATVQARYLFGAPMARAVLTWTARQAPVSPWEIEIPGVEDWYLGESGAWWEDSAEEPAQVIGSGVDTLDARGERALAVTLPATPKGRPARVTLEVGVTDINRQAVGATRSTIVHPAEFYVAAKPLGASYFWQAGTPQSVAVLAVRPDGQKVAGVRVQGTVVRREWHRVRRERGGLSEVVGDWVSDTVAHCTVTTAESAVPCAFTPNAGGTYTVAFTATDRNGRAATTSFQRWASGTDWVPWNDESQFKMDVIPDRTRYAVGDTATVLFASPFTNAEAWITVEREGIIEQRRLRLTSGSTTLKFPITEAYAPNAFVSILVARGRSAQPGPRDDPGRPTIRVGYAELRVTPEVKRLAVTIEPERPEYRPADSARVRVRVRDTRGAGARSEVTLWAVDEGVLSLTGYTTPDPIDLIYQARGLGLRLASNVTTVAPQVPEGMKGTREPGGGGGAAGADVLRSRFQTTAFFLGSVVTDAAGNATITTKLPDNLTTFRVMAVAVTAGDRYGKGQSPLLVTRPLLARQALPRFVRPGDDFTAGAVINRRDGTAATVKVTAAATGVTLRGDGARTATLAAGRGAEVRFPFRASRGSGSDSATFRFDVTGGGDADAVRVTLPVRPDFHPRAHTIAGVLRDSATVELALPAGIDPERSRLSLNLGTSPLATIRGIEQSLHIYPYYCTEQVVSTATPILALYRAQRLAGTATTDAPRREIARAVDMLTRRQRVDGAIGYWSSSDWSSVWLSSYAGIVLLDAREAGVAVDTMVLSRLAGYVASELRGESKPVFSPVASYYERPEIRLRERVAAVDFLSRLRRPEVASENELLRSAAILTLEDRARLAEVLARRAQLPAARRLMAATWSQVRVEGTRAVLSDTTVEPFYFASTIRPLARVLMATLAVEPEHALVGPLAETLAQQGRAQAKAWMWNTQDYASAVTALAVLDQRRRAQGERSVRVRSGNRVILQASTGQAGRDSTISLAGLLPNGAGAPVLRLSLDAGAGTGVVYYYFTVSEVPLAPPVTPDDNGIRVERWYERLDGGTPITRVAEGDLVRVRLRIAVPSMRQFVVVDDALPAGLEAVDLSLRTASAMPGPGATSQEPVEQEGREDQPQWGFGRWDSGWWSPFDYREIRDDRVVYSANVLWPGTYTATYVARATTPGTFIRPPVHAEEMYNPAVNGRSDGGVFVVTPR